MKWKVFQRWISQELFCFNGVHRLRWLRFSLDPHAIAYSRLIIVQYNFQYSMNTREWINWNCKCWRRRLTMVFLGLMRSTVDYSDGYCLALTRLSINRRLMALPIQRIRGHESGKWKVLQTCISRDFSSGISWFSDNSADGKLSALTLLTSTKVIWQSASELVKWKVLFFLVGFLP